MKLVHINSVGGDLYVVKEYCPPVDPGYGGGLPANPAFPSNTLPSGPPVGINQGETLVLVRDPMGVWHYAAIQPGSPPPRPLPEPTPPPVATQPPMPGYGLPGGPPPMPGQPLPPTAAPKK